jgi:hypothetical protein
MKAKLLNFLKYGAWGDLQIGNSIENSALNEAAKMPYRKDEKEPFAIFYDEDTVEISIFQNKITRLGLRDPQHSKFWGKQPITLSRFILYLNRHKVEWNFKQNVCLHKQIGIETVSGVTILFNYSDDDHAMCTISR